MENSSFTLAVAMLLVFSDIVFDASEMETPSLAIEWGEGTWNRLKAGNAKAHIIPRMGANKEHVVVVVIIHNKECMSQLAGFPQ